MSTMEAKDKWEKMAQELRKQGYSVVKKRDWSNCCKCGKALDGKSKYYNYPGWCEECAKARMKECRRMRKERAKERRAGMTLKLIEKFGKN